MTGGVVAVLGDVGRNACAGMTGGTAYFLSDAPPAWLGGHDTVADAGMDAAAVAELSALLESHAAHTGSEAARALLAEPEALAKRFVRVRPAPSGVSPSRTSGRRRHERGASVTQAQHTLVACERSREYAPREIRGAGVGPAMCPERRTHGD